MQDSQDKEPARIMTEPFPPIGWAISPSPVAYPDSLAVMERRAALIAAGVARELVWLLEHPACYTAGTSAKPEDLLAPDRFPVFAAGRGGQFTYHGPGQRVAYVMVDVRRRFGGDVRAFVSALENILIAALARFGVAGETRQGRVGIWVRAPDGGRNAEDKIAAIGLRIRKGISFHGLSLNVAPDLSHYAGIVPCGIAGPGVTSLAALGRRAGMADVDAALRSGFERAFGMAQSAADPMERAIEPLRHS